MTITEFLLARIEEDEVGAMASVREISDSLTSRGFPEEASGADEWATDDSDCPWTDIEPDVGRANGLESARHIARWDPTRVLAECAAKRRLIRYTEEDVTIENDWVILTHLALPYADHSDYDPAWRAE